MLGLWGGEQRLARLTQPLMTFVVVDVGMLSPPNGQGKAATGRREEGREEGGREGGYLLWELRVVESGLKDACGKDWKRDKETT